MITYTLKKPVEHNGKSYEVLTFREASAGDLMTAELVVGGKLAQTVAILACMCDVPLPAFRQISARDLNSIMGEASELLGNDPEPTTGD